MAPGILQLSPVLADLMLWHGEAGPEVIWPHECVHCAQHQKKRDTERLIRLGIQSEATLEHSSLNRGENCHEEFRSVDWTVLSCQDRA